jgi:hypothetical protein
VWLTSKRARHESDSLGVTESPLDKVLRLAGGTTRSYVRMHQGRLQRVSAYPTPRQRHVAWGSLKPGQKVLLNNVPFQVVKVGVPLSKAELAFLQKGKAAAAAKLKAQGPSAAQQAALKKATAASAKAKVSGAAAPAAAKAAVKPVHIDLRNLVTRRTVVMSMAANAQVVQFG